MPDRDAYVAGDVVLESCELLRFEMPALKEVSGELRASRCETLLFPKLHSVNGPFALNFNESLETVEMPLLAHVDGILHWTDNNPKALPSLKSIVEALRKCGYTDDVHLESAPTFNAPRSPKHSKHPLVSLQVGVTNMS